MDIPERGSRDAGDAVFGGSPDVLRGGCEPSQICELAAREAGVHSAMFKAQRVGIWKGREIRDVACDNDGECERCSAAARTAKV